MHRHLKWELQYIPGVESILTDFLLEWNEKCNQLYSKDCTACTANLVILSVFKIAPTQDSIVQEEKFSNYAYGTYFRITRKLWNFQKEHILICTEVFLILGIHFKILKFTLGIASTDFFGVGFFLDQEPYPHFKGGVVV